MTRVLLHGGPSGLRVGDYLLPAQMLGLAPRIKTPNQPRYSPMWVYLTEREDYARIFASRTGSVYQAMPVGATEPDPDARAAWRTRRALIVGVLA